MAIQPPDPSVFAALTNYQGTYHNHKKQLGYAAAALYVGGAVVLFFAPARWSAYPSWAKGPFLALLAMTGVAGLFYVFWQFDLRSIAADRIEWFLDQLNRDVYWHGEGPGGSFQRWAAPGTALLVMLLWGAAAFVRVVCSLGP